MRPNFEYYMASLDGWPFSVGVDLAICDKVPLRELPHRVHVRFEFNHPTEDGLCTTEEAALLTAIEQEFVATLPLVDHRLVAVVDHRNSRTLVVHCRHHAVGLHPILRLLDRIETHRTKVVEENDPEWTEYREVLYPNRDLLHQIKDRRLLREFERRGDDCCEVHSIEPRFEGLDEERARRLAAELVSEGFAVKEIAELGANGTKQWGVTGAVASPLGLAILDAFRNKWLALADRVGGSYQGWSAEVIPVDGENNNTGCGGHLFPSDEDREV